MNKEIPTQIWLQWYGDATEMQQEDELNEFNRPVCTEDVTWCTERMWHADIGPYILASDNIQIAASVLEELDQLRAQLEQVTKERDDARAQRDRAMELAERYYLGEYKPAPLERLQAEIAKEKEGSE